MKIDDSSGFSRSYFIISNCVGVRTGKTLWCCYLRWVGHNVSLSHYVSLFSQSALSSICTYQMFYFFYLPLMFYYTSAFLCFGIRYSVPLSLDQSFIFERHNYDIFQSIFNYLRVWPFISESKIKINSW